MPKTRLIFISPAARTYVRMDCCAVFNVGKGGLPYIATSGISTCIGLAMVRFTEDDECPRVLMASLAHLSGAQRQETFARSYMRQFVDQLGGDSAKINLYLMFSSESDRKLASSFVNSALCVPWHNQEEVKSKLGELEHLKYQEPEDRGLQKERRRKVRLDSEDSSPSASTVEGEGDKTKAIDLSLTVDFFVDLRTGECALYDEREEGIPDKFRYADLRIAEGIEYFFLGDGRLISCADCRDDVRHALVSADTGASSAAPTKKNDE